MQTSRRGFLAAAATAAAQAAPQRKLQTFTPEEAELLEALCEQIIPRDDDPGARDAGVLHYIDRQLAGPLERFTPFYRAGLAALVKTEFPKLAFEKQTEFLKNMEAGKLTGPAWKLQSAASFFNMVIDHTMQGFYGSPQHGGNRNEASWKMLDIQKVMRGDHHSHTESKA
jgi:gluconate 2-dehydrogenase gamma chain